MEFKYQYKSLSKLTKIAVVMTVILNACQIVGNITNQIDFRMYTPLDFSEDEFTFSPNHTIDIIMYLVVILNIVVIPASVIFFLWWIFRANQNIHVFGSMNIYSPKMAIVWFFVPFLNLRNGYRTVKQIWKASHPDVSLITGTEWNEQHLSLKTVRAWWISGIIIFLVFVAALFLIVQNNLLLRFSLLAIESGVLWSNILLIYTVSSITSVLLPIIPTVFYIRMINQVSKWQDIKANDDKISFLKE